MDKQPCLYLKQPRCTKLCPSLSIIITTITIVIIMNIVIMITMSALMAAEMHAASSAMI